MVQMYGNTILRDDYEGFEGIFLSTKIYNMLKRNKITYDDIYDENKKCKMDICDFSKINKLGAISLKIIEKYIINREQIESGSCNSDFLGNDKNKNDKSFSHAINKVINKNEKEEGKGLSDIIKDHLSKNKPVEFNVLGTTYRLFFKAEENLKVSNKTKEGKRHGYCKIFDSYITIYVSKNYNINLENENKIRHIIRHEIIHAFIHESGLYHQSHSPIYGWANDEEIIDWFAAQYPKMYPIFKQLDLLDNNIIMEIKEEKDEK